MPGHNGSASFEENHDGELVLWCDCFGAEGKTRAFRGQHWYALSDAYYSVTSGVVLDRDNHKLPNRFVWRLLMLEASNTVWVDAVDLPELSADASPELQQARELFISLVGIRQTLADCINEPPLPCPMSRSLVGAYCRHPQPGMLITGLINAHVIELAGHAPPVRSGYRGAALYTPCPLF